MWSTGPIPSTKVEAYAFRHGFPTDMIGPFTRILRKLDDDYIGWMNDEIKRQADVANKKRGFAGLFRRRK